MQKVLAVLAAKTRYSCVMHGNHFLEYLEALKPRRGDLPKAARRYPMLSVGMCPARKRSKICAQRLFETPWVEPALNVSTLQCDG